MSDSRGFGHTKKRMRLLAAAAAGAALLAVAGCGSGSPQSSSSKPNEAVTTAALSKDATPTKGGTVTWAEAPGQAPDYIFPLCPFADFSVANLSQFQELMYRPLYWFGDDNKPTVDYDRSVGKKPVFSAGDTVVTVTLNHYVWSDGETVDARDVELWMNLLDAEKDNWAAYVPGYFPDNVASVTAPKGPTGNVVVFKLKRSYNPTWFLYNELSQITPLPVAWDKTSASAPTPSPSAAHLPDTTHAGAVAVYKFLTNAAKQISTYATNPLWKVVDGPWTLQSLTTTGQATLVPNPKYVGPFKPYLSKVVEEPYTSDAAEYNQVKEGPHTLNIGYIPNQNAVQASSVKREGYTSSVDYLYDFNYMPLNFNNAKAGPLFKQLYIRQALQYLIDQAGWIKAYDSDLAAPTYGPVPVEPSNPFADKFEKSNPYPFSVSKAKSLLSSHGWKVHSGGTTRCEHPGTGAKQCGAGITKGEGLSFHLLFASGYQFLTESMADYKSVAAEAGIQFTTSQASFDDVIGEAVPCTAKQAICSWQIANWGQGWVYAPDYYATGEELFATGAGSNAGSYTSAETDRLIAKSTTVGEPQSQPALDAYQDYLAKQLPVLYQPALAGAPSSGLNVVANFVGGVQSNVFGNLTPENWYLKGKK